MCVAKDLLVRFYGGLEFFPMRIFIHQRVFVAFGKPFDYFLVEEPWRVHEVLEKAIGRRKAELFIQLLTEWLRKSGCGATPEEVRQALSDKSAWTPSFNSGQTGETAPGPGKPKAPPASPISTACRCNGGRTTS